MLNLEYVLVHHQTIGIPEFAALNNPCRSCTAHAGPDTKIW